MSTTTVTSMGGQRNFFIQSIIEIGECSIIGAGSVVTDSVPAYSVAAGVPAKVIKSFSRQDVIEEYL